jgi:threonine dehydrogenase-like Zn-dependent dehydrogenase
VSESHDHWSGNTRGLCRVRVSSGERIGDGAGRSTDNEVAALQPLSSCVADVESAELKMGDTVVVLGLGSMGLGCMQIAKVGVRVF